MRRVRSMAIVPSREPSRLVDAVTPSISIREHAPHLELDLAGQLEGLPRDLGVALVVLGMFGIVIPGPIPPSFSFVLLGLIALRPSLLARTGGPIARRCPIVFHILIGLVGHFRSDVARRYPGSVPEK